jgi:hypothetical protein
LFYFNKKTETWLNKYKMEDTPNHFEIEKNQLSRFMDYLKFDLESAEQTDDKMEV